jgi:transcription elongation GreA/GreB family factor
MNEFKAKIYQAAINQLKDKEDLLTTERKNIIESILEDEKSSAGDKYETGRETMTQDLNTIEGQIKQGKSDLEELYRLHTIKETPSSVQEGALVKLGQDWFLIAVSIGALKVGDSKVFLMSKNSPLGELLIGKKHKDQVSFRGKVLSIEELV